MRLKNRENFGRLCAWVGQNCHPESHSAILHRLVYDKFPPYEFWLAIGHTHQGRFERMVGRGIARWIEQQPEYLQDFILPLLEGDLGDCEDAAFEQVCLNIWVQMLPSDWLSLHAIDTSAKSQLWGRAIVHVHYAVIHDEWNALRNYQPEFFIPEEADNA